ncbi:MAG: hypothetical protein GKR92_02625 [Gammaproteobacteria bacterium]|nr:MAG: hypothetical protein GKR92_02625 [Gammaproteobacteria bacterium]
MGAKEEYITSVVCVAWKCTGRYSELRALETVLLPKVEISYIGGSI